jgi:single-strand DNA-binding protein
MSTNVVVISGRVVRVDEMKINPQSGNAYIPFAVACNRMSKDKKADFFNCMAFGKTAELVADLLSKGDQLTINGRLQIDEWEKNGEKRTAPKIIVNGFDKMWPPKQQEGTSPEQQEGTSHVSGGLQESNFDFNG